MIESDAEQLDDADPGDGESLPDLPPPPPPAAAEVIERLAHEQWAERLGMANLFGDPSGEFPKANPLYQDYAQAKAYCGWIQGVELTEVEFRKAIHDAKSHTFR